MTHLHVHSHFSLLGATPSVAQLAARAAADGLSHLALTDADALYGAVAFGRACQAAGVQPIIGMTLHVQPPDSIQTSALPGPDLLVLLACGSDGYRSLCRLSSAVQGGADRGQTAARGLEWERLAANRQGLLCVAGGRRSWVEHLLRQGDAAGAARYVSHLAGLFDDRVYLALELHRHEDEAVAREVESMAARFGLPCVAVQPVYCLERHQQTRLRLLAAIDHNCRLDAVPVGVLPDDGDPGIDLHWLSPAEMASRFANFPAALDQRSQVSARCIPCLPDGRPLWPVLKLPEGQTPASALAEMASAGLTQRYGLQPQPAAHSRLASELETIIQHGYAPLFLVVADIVRFARSQDIPVSTRGSVANSLVAYCIGITTVDPIAYDLLFERFLSPARTNPPDIDLDFCSRRRDEVLNYVRQTYGEEQVALVATISTMKPRSALRETGKAYGLDEAAIAGLIALAPTGWHPDPRRRTSTTIDDVLHKLDDPRLRLVVTDAWALLDQPHHLSVHPGAVVVAPGPITDFVPVQWSPKGFLITQFDHVDIEAIGLPKIDLLGIRALTVLADAAVLVRRHYDSSFRLDAIPLADPATAHLLEMAETVGVFQCESSGARRTLRQLKVRTLSDLAVANAFFKPGPATGGMAGAFVRRYRGEEQVSYLHPSLAPILGPTRGVLLFQEQILRVARQIAGLSWEQADHLRRGMSKFQSQEMAAMQAEFVAGCRRPDGPGLSAQQAATLWEQVAAFAGYGFNQGHATAYADVSYRSAYLKAHWPAAFLCARLAGWGGFHHPVIYIAEALRLGIAVRPPHVNHSGLSFSLEDVGPTPPFGAAGADHPATLWMGLGQVRDLRNRSIRAILAERRQRPFTGLRDLLNRVSLQSKETAHLIQCGALDGLGQSRAAVLAEAGSLGGSARQLAFDFVQGEVLPDTAADRLAWERRILGWPVSVTPLDLVAGSLIDITQLSEMPSRTGQRLRTAGFRLPGWTGGKGFFLGDGRSYAVAIPAAGLSAPRSWEPVVVQGRWLNDEWGMGWLQVEGFAAA